MKHNDEKGGGITVGEIERVAGLLIIAGSETSATTLSGALYYLLKNQDWIQKLLDELKENFKDESEMDFNSLGRMKVLNAIIWESLRVYPAVPTMLNRVSPAGGATICGEFVPPGTQLGIPMYAAFRSSRYWADPDKYDPARFMGDEKYAHDMRSEYQPFSVGPRNCIGQNLAMAEMRTILARLVWNFKMELEKPEEDWLGTNKVFILWDKPPLMVKLTAR